MRDVKDLLGTLENPEALINAPIHQVDKITHSEVNSRPGEVFVVDALMVGTNGPDKQTIASISSDKAIVSVTYHLGRSVWNMEIEYKAQKAKEFRALSLNNAINAFEECTGVTLPEIPVTEYGVGIYPAKHAERNGDPIDNPWEMKTGIEYQVVGRLGTIRKFVALEDGHGERKIAFIDAETGTFDEKEMLDPRGMLSVHDWEYLRKYEIPKHQQSRSRNRM